jgi:hypothetical protein
MTTYANVNTLFRIYQKPGAGIAKVVGLGRLRSKVHVSSSKSKSSIVGFHSRFVPLLCNQRANALLVYLTLSSNPHRVLTRGISGGKGLLSCFNSGLGLMGALHKQYRSDSCESIPMLFSKVNFLFSKYFSNHSFIFLKIALMGLLGTFFLTLICYLSPSFCLVFMIITTSVMLIICFPFHLNNKLNEKRLSLIKLFIEVIHTFNLINILATIYINVFSLTPKRFKMYAFFLFIPIFFYPIISRYYYYLIIVDHAQISFNLYLLYSSFLFLGLFFIYLRLTLTFSILVTHLTYTYNPTLLNPAILYILDNEPPIEPIQPITTNKSLFHVDGSKHTHYHSYVFANSNFLKKLGICTAVAGTCMAFYTALQMAQQTDIQRLHLKDSMEQTRQIDRQNDLEEVSQGLRSTESYNAKWGNVPVNSTELSAVEYDKLSNRDKMLIADQSRNARNKK